MCRQRKLVVCKFILFFFKYLVFIDNSQKTQYWYKLNKNQHFLSLIRVFNYCVVHITSKMVAFRLFRIFSTV